MSKEGELKRRNKELYKSDDFYYSHPCAEFDSWIDEAKQEFAPVIRELNKELRCAYLHGGNSHSPAGQHLRYLIEKWFGDME